MKNVCDEGFVTHESGQSEFNVNLPAIYGCIIEDWTNLYIITSRSEAGRGYVWSIIMLS